MTDRGEVFIGLGSPDEVFDSSSDLQGPARIIRWTYLGERLVLDFVDDTGFGRFRLTRITSYNVCYTKLLRGGDPVPQPDVQVLFLVRSAVEADSRADGEP